MTQSITQIRCPNCQSPIKAAVEQLLDVAEDPGAKARLLSGSLNFIRCPTCNFEGQLATPIVYHDPEHELLLTFMPVELNIPKQETERLIGQLINQVTNRLPPDQRKAYLLQPQAVLTMQGMIERVLEADGITKEDIEAQRAKMRLFEDLLRTPEDSLDAFISEHDEDMDSVFFQLASMTLQSTANAQAREMINQRLEAALRGTTFGKRIASQEEELRRAMESLQEIGEELSQEKILDLIIQAPNDDRLVGLVNLTRPALDYTFFQLLTDRIDSSSGDEKQRLMTLRERVLEVTQQIDKVQEARAVQSANLLLSLVEADDLDNAIANALPLVDDLFLGILQANIQASSESGDQETHNKLLEIRSRLQALAEDSIPPGIRLAQELVNIEDKAQAEKLLNESVDQIDDQMLAALMATAENLTEQGDKKSAEHVRAIYRKALSASMKAKMKKDAI